MYFASHPRIEYDGHEAVNIFRSSRLLKKLNTNRFLLKEYIIQDGETPELVSFNLYDNAKYHWSIIIINSIVNLNTQWPLSSNNLFKYVEEKYEDPNGFHHYEDEEETIVDAPPGVFGQLLSDMTVTNLEYETKINDNKSKIKVLHSSHLNSFVTEFKETIKGSRLIKRLS
jgi:hypothetical protein